MSIDIGYALSPGPQKGDVQKWMNDIDRVLPVLAGHVKSIWMSDHLFWDDQPTYEAWTTIAYLAGKYPDFVYGNGVLGQAYRNPALLAKMSASFQILSQGRFILGIGAGWKDDEHHAYNLPFASPKLRLEQLEDTLQIVKLMWQTPGPVSFVGKHYQIQDAYCEPLPDSAPLIMIGGGGKTTMKHAAKYADWWNLSDAPIDLFTERLNILEAHCAAIGRDFSTIRKTWYGRLIVAKDNETAIEKAHKLGRTHYNGWTAEGALVGTPEQILGKLKPFVDIGVDYFMWEIPDIDDDSIQKMLIEEIIPELQRL